jgi:hypothetical protein
MSRRCYDRRCRNSRKSHVRGLDLQGSVMSLDGVYDCPHNRKAIFNRTRAAESIPSEVVSRCSMRPYGEKSVDELGQAIFELMLATASGAMSKSELHGYGQNEFVPWQIGAIT